MTEQADPKVEEGLNRARKPRSDEQRAYSREYKKRKREEKKAAKEGAAAAGAADGLEFPQGHTPEDATPSVPHIATGITEDDRIAMDLTVRLHQAEARVRESAISEGAKQMIHEEIQVDSCNRLRRFVELTPSRCRRRNCPYDSAKEAGATDWNNAPINQPMDNGKTFGQRLIEVREYHEATAHTSRELDDHIITADELHKRQWGIGQDIRGDFLGAG